jgi:hypothetical protein
MDLTYMLMLVLPYVAIGATFTLTAAVTAIIYSQPARIRAAGFAV